MRIPVALAALLISTAAAAEELLQTVCQGEAAVQTALQDGASPTSTDAEGQTPLHALFRCRTGSGSPSSVAALLLEVGVPADAMDAKGRSSLHAALENNVDLATVKLLLEHGADPGLADQAGVQPLHLAAGQTDPAIAALLLERSANLDSRDASKHTPLHYAVRGQDNLATFELLFERAQHNKSKSWTLTELAGLAVERRRHDVVNLLLQRDPELKLDAAALTATLESALWRGAPLPLAERLTVAGAQPAALQADAHRDLAWRLAMLGREQELIWLLGHGWDLNRFSAQGYPPLYFADAEAARLLLEQGANPALQGEVVGTVLMPVAPPPPAYEDAPTRFTPERARLLLGAGYPVNQRDREGHTALQLAVATDNLALVQRLLLHDADPTLHAPGTASLLAQALRRGRLPVVQALLRAQPGFARTQPALLVDYINGDKIDPLLVEALLVAGAPVDARSAQDETALLTAARRQHWKLLPLLLQYGADPMATNAQGCTLHCYEWAMPEATRALLPGGADHSAWQVPSLQQAPLAFFAAALVPTLVLWLVFLGWCLARSRSLTPPTLWLLVALGAGILAGGGLFFECAPCIVADPRGQLALTAAVAAGVWLSLLWRASLPRPLVA